MARRPTPEDRIEAATGFVRLRFNASNPRAEQTIADQGGRLVTRLTEDTRRALVEAIQAGYSKGLGPREIALDIAGRLNSKGQREGGIIGLTAPQAQAALNLRDRLTSNVPSEMRKVLGMKLRDARFDSQILKAIKSGEPLSTDKIDQMYDRYVSNALLLRGETVARTETAQAVMSASRQSFIQGLEKAGVTEDAVTRTWDSAGDERTRDSHAEMDGQTVQGLEEPFVSPSGAELLFPMDASLGAPPEEIIACRCECNYTIDYSKGLELFDDELDPPDGEDGLDAQVGAGGLNLTDSVLKLLRESPSGRSIDDMAKELLVQFPDRSIEKIKASISSLFSRPPKSLNVKFVRGAGGLYRIDGTPPIVRPPEPPVVQPPIFGGGGSLTQQFLSIVTSGTSRTVDEIADIVKASFPDRGIDDIRNSIRSLMSRLPKQGKLIITKEKGGRISGRFPIGGETVTPPVRPTPVEQPRAPVLRTFTAYDPKAQSLEGDWVPRSNSADWTTYEEARRGFFDNHGIRARSFSGFGGASLRDVPDADKPKAVAQIKEVDRALTDLKNRFPAMRQMEMLRGGLQIRVDNGLLDQRANGLHYTYEHRMQLAGGKLELKEKAVDQYKQNYYFDALTSPLKWTVADDSLANTFRHELGHNVERTLYDLFVGEKKYRALGETADPGMKADSEEFFRPSFGRQVVQATRYYLDKLNANPNTIKPSRYGGSNGAEFWAESFAAYTNPAFVPGSKMIDPEIEEIFDKIFKPREELRRKRPEPKEALPSAAELVSQSRALAARGEGTLIGNVRQANTQERAGTFTALSPNGARAPGFRTEREAWEYLARVYIMDNR